MVGLGGAAFVNQMEWMVRILCAGILGAVIGYERKNRNKSAGVRTHAIVALGAALIMVVSKYGFFDMPGGDGSRVAAQVVSGVGFLGAGIIFIRNNAVSGLTTAAGIWTTAGVGLALGAGMYEIGAVSSVFVIGLQVIMHKVDLFAKEAYVGTVRMQVENDKVDECLRILADERIDVVYSKISKDKHGEQRLELEVVYPPGYDKLCLLGKLAGQKDVTAVRV